MASPRRAVHVIAGYPAELLQQHYDALREGDAEAAETLAYKHMACRRRTAI